MRQRSGGSRVRQIGLLEEVRPIRCVVVGGERDLTRVRRHRAGHEVLVGAVIAADHRARLNRHAAGAMLQGHRAEIHLRVHVAVVRIAVERRGIDIRRTSLKGGDPAVGDTSVFQVLVSDCHLRVLAGRERQRRVDAASLEIDAVAEAAGVLVHPVQSQRHGVRDGLVEIEREPPVVEASSLKRELAQWLEDRLLGDAVDHASAASSSEDERVRPLQRLDAIEVVQVAVVLHVVPHPVDEEVGRGAVAADDHLIPVVLSLMRADARDVADDVADARHQLVGNQFVRHDRDRLGHVSERRGRPRRAADRRDLVTAPGADVHRLARPLDLEHELARLAAGFRGSQALDVRHEARRADGDRRMSPGRARSVNSPRASVTAVSLVPGPSGDATTRAPTTGARLVSRTVPWSDRSGTACAAARPAESQEGKDQ